MQLISTLHLLPLPISFIFISLQQYKKLTRNEWILIWNSLVVWFYKLWLLILPQLIKLSRLHNYMFREKFEKKTPSTLVIPSYLFLSWPWPFSFPFLKNYFLVCSCMSDMNPDVPAVWPSWTPAWGGCHILQILSTGLKIACNWKTCNFEINNIMKPRKLEMCLAPKGQFYWDSTISQIRLSMCFQ